MLRITPLDDASAAAWGELFDACASPCFCRYWQFEGTKNEWLARCAHEPGENRRAQLVDLAAGGDAARGLVALRGDVAVGWMKLAPRRRLEKLTRLPVYRALRLGADPGVFVVGCLLVRPDHRRRGVARALVAAADAQVLAWGGRAIEAFPRRSDAPIHDEEAWMGPERLFVEAGYAVVAGEPPYLVYRKLLSPQGPPVDLQEGDLVTSREAPPRGGAAW